MCNLYCILYFMAKGTYITTTLPYVNADPHVGFAMEIIQADAIVRYWRLLGNDVFFNTGTDEHGLKIYRKAVEQGKDPQAYVDEYAAKFRNLKDVLGISDVNFIRTTDPHHVKAAQEFWKRCADAGDIYKKNYSIKYCVGCELEKTDSDLVSGRCSVHPNLEIESIEEENYFFRQSKYRERLLDLYRERPNFVMPDSRFNEIRAFVERGLEDFSISRLKSKMPWGVPVPGDPSQVMYVWFDALVNYISAIGWPNDLDTFNAYWPVVQFAGKDQVRMQAAMWQTMLMSADIAASQEIVIHGFITSGGQKMSKSLGNVINPYGVVEEYGTDALRYYLLREIPTFEDGDFTIQRFKDAYNANLANGIGNLTSRIMRMATANDVAYELGDKREWRDQKSPIRAYLEGYEIKKAMDDIWERIGKLDSFIQEAEPFKKIKTNPEAAKHDIAELVTELFYIALDLAPFLPATSGKILDSIKNKKMPEPLFVRKE